MKNIIKPSESDYNTNKKIIEELIKEYPFLNVQIIGRTALSRGIFSLSLGNNKNNVIYVGSVSGNDSLSGLLLLIFIQKLCHSIKNSHLLCSVDINKAFSKLGVTVIPCLNPDGREIALHGAEGAKSMGSFVSSFSTDKLHSWKANAMGVDINHNFGASKESAALISEEHRIFAPSPAFYGGEYPESEAETKALTRLCRTIPFRQCLELKTGDNEIFWRYKDIEPPQSSMMAKILSCSCNFSLSDELSLHGGFKDWFIKEFNRPGFTLEAGIDHENFYDTYQRIEEALTIFALF